MRVVVDLLGPVRVRVGEQEMPGGGVKLRAIVALLALAEGRVVGVDRILDEVWGEDLPATAKNTLQYHVGVLRRSLGVIGGEDAVLTRPPGYALVATTDVAAFTTLAHEGDVATAEGRHEAAAERLRAALDLWRGQPLADLRAHAFGEAHGVALENQRLACLESWVDAEMACGRAEQLVQQLQALVADNPTRERLWEQLMVALYRTGRQDAALSAFRSALRALDRELGVQPSARLRGVHEQILRQDAALAPGPRPVTARPLVSRTSVVGPGSDALPYLVTPGGSRVALADRPVVIGRDEGCDLVLADQAASRHHARIDPSEGGYVVVDLSSTNGTFLNGSRVEQATRVADGDRIEVGRSLVRFEHAVPAEVSPA